MPTSVLLAVLVAASLLALAPALVRRYDATERLDAERASSTARLLVRDRRRRSVPGRMPVNPPRAVVERGQDPPERAARPVSGRPPRRPVPADARPRGAGPAADDPRARDAGPAPDDRRPPRPANQRMWWRRRRRQVFVTLTVLFCLEAAGTVMVGPGFFVGLALSGLLLGWYVAVLRHRVVVEQRLRRRRRRLAMERRAAEKARQRRIAERQRRIAEARRHAEKLARRQAEEARQALEDQGSPRAAGLRGRPYEARAVNL